MVLFRHTMLLANLTEHTSGVADDNLVGWNFIYYDTPHTDERAVSHVFQHGTVRPQVARLPDVDMPNDSNLNRNG